MNALRWLGNKIALWNRISMQRHWSMQTMIRPSLIGLINERRRQKKRMRKGF